MPQKVKKDGIATVMVGTYELRRKVFAGDEVPEAWDLSAEAPPPKEPVKAEVKDDPKAQPKDEPKAEK